MLEDEIMNYPYDDSNQDREQEVQISSIKEMLNIVKNLASIQMDEEKVEDKSIDFLNEYLYKHIKKNPLTLYDTKRIVEIHISKQKKYSIHRLSKLTGVQRKTIRIWKINYNFICEQENLNISSIKKQGRSYSFSDKGMQLIGFIDKLKEEKIAVTSTMIIAKML